MHLYLFATILLLATAYVVSATWVSRRARQLRVVHCPATGSGAALHLRPGRSAWSLGVSPPTRVTQCSLWPERRLCAQSCLAEIHESPEHCAFQKILARWYCGKRCAFCARDIPPVCWGEIRPSLLSPDRRVVAWIDIHPPAVYDVLSTHRPVCASCGVAEAFREQHPDLVVERPHAPTPDKWSSPSP